MQITCSKCKKVYNVDPNRIPRGVTGTKCKACGNSISLRPAAPQAHPAHKTPPAPKTAGMQITCQYCSKKYNINPKSILEGVTSINCKACGHAISLKPKSEEPPPKPVPTKTAIKNTDTREITCLYCGKKYSINAGKIPPGVKTTKCKACGRNMSLKPVAGLTSAFKDEISKKVIPIKTPNAPKDLPASQVPIIQNIEPSTSPLWQKPWVLAAAAAVLVLCIGVYYTGSKVTQLAKVKLGTQIVIKKERQAPGQKPESGTIAEPEPVLAVQIDVPRLLEAMDQNIPEDKKNLKYKMTTGIFKSFALGKVQLYLYPQPEHTFLPVILAESEKGKRLEKQLKLQENYVQFFERLSDGSYAIKKEAISENKLNNFPIDLYRLQFIDNTAVFAPPDLFQIFKEGADPVRKSQVGRMMASIARPRDLVLLSLRIPEDFSPDWQKKIQSNPAWQQNPQTAMIASIGGAVLAQLSEPLKGGESLALGIRLDDTGGRQLSYAQQFRKGADGRKIYQQLRSGKHDVLNGGGIVLKLIELLNNPLYKHNIFYNNNRLTMEFNWEKQHDKAFLTALSEATLGQMFAQGTDLTPSEGPITVQYEEPPRLSANVDVNNLKLTIPDAVQQSLLPGNYWGSGDQPRMTLELDTIDVPNASLAELTYEVLEVLTTDGKNVMRTEENQLQPKINPANATPGTIDLNLKKDTAAEMLASAKIRFHIHLPASFKKMEFVSGNSPGTLRESEGVWVKLGRLEKDVAQITYHGGTSAHLFAFDKTGRSLASGESMNSSWSVATRFQGEIHTLMVVVVQEMLDYPFEVYVHLNRGKELTLFHQPGNFKKQQDDNPSGLLGAKKNK
jgi:DNA-directed RNA polymerase subunit RPC12/RpoP